MSIAIHISEMVLRVLVSGRAMGSNSSISIKYGLLSVNSTDFQSLLDKDFFFKLYADDSYSG